MTPARSIRLPLVLSVCAAMAIVVRVSPAAERHLEFVHRLQQRGYVDVALDYLDWLETRPNLPSEVRETLDLERCNCYLVWAKAAVDAKLNQQRLAQAQAYLDKFLKEHPNHPRAATAMAFWGDSALERGRQLLVGAERVADKDKRVQALAEARASLQDAGRRLGQATEMYHTWLARLPAASEKAGAGVKPLASLAERLEVEAGALEARFKLALVYYYVGQTYEGSDEDLRAQMLRKAAARFDGIYQELRHTASQGCLFAHLWQARTLQELGQTQDALDIYDELLASAPDTAESESEMAPLYAEAAFFQIRAAARPDKLNDFVSKATQWLQAHQGWRRLSGYLGLTLEVAKAQLALAEKAEGDARRKLIEQAMAALETVAKTPSEHREEAILLRRAELKESGRGHITVDEFFALGDSALAAKQFPEAEQNYTKALEFATQNKNDQLAAAARRRLSRVRYAQALALYSAGKLEESLAAAGELARGDRSDPSVSHAALLSLSAALAIFGKADDKDAAIKRLEGVVELLVKNWSGRPEADDARIALGQARLFKGDTQAAMDAFRQVTATSARYPTVLYVLGQVYWRTYLAERRKAETSRDVALMKDSLAKTRKHLEEAVELMRKGIRADAADPGSQLTEAQLLLAEVMLEGREYRQAVALLDPLVMKIKALKPSMIDKATFGTFITAVRAHLAIGEADRAADMALVLVEITQDQAKFNEVLVTFVRLLTQELRRAEADVSHARPGDVQTVQAASAKRDALRQMIPRLLDPLLKRQEYSAADLASLGDACSMVGLTDQALKQYERMVAKAKEEPGAATTADRAVVRARAQLIGLLRTEGKFEEAVKQSDELIAKNPRSLEPRLVRAQILEDWAKKDPTKFDAAVAQWTEVRTLLGRMANKPPEYYESIYRTASCLFSQAEATKDPSKLLQAEQVLKSTMVLHSRLSGPDMVGRYNDLLKRILDARPKTPAAGGKGK